MSNERQRGGIYSTECYARGKMLDHTGWNTLLPRNITPSDIDSVFDDNGKILLVEFNSRSACWADLPYGQRKMYVNMLVAGKGDILAVCARHRIPEPGVEIDTAKDVLEYQEMTYQGGEIDFGLVRPGESWAAYVQSFFGSSN